MNGHREYNREYNEHHEQNKRNGRLVSSIENGKVTRKENLKLPKAVENIIYCKNPRCITSIEPEIPHIFHLQNAEKRIYRCTYCEDHVHGIEI